MIEDICANHHGDNPESLAAAATTHAARDRKLVLDQLRHAGTRGMTCDELEQVLNLRHQTCSARCSELKRDGIVVTNGQRRKTRTGCNAAVLFAVKISPPVKKEMPAPLPVPARIGSQLQLL